MTTSTPSTSIDGVALRQAVQSHDVDTLAGLYADDATIEIVDAGHPPTTPLRLRGAAQIGARLRDVYERDMTHEVDLVAVGADALAYTVRCTYPDGGRVVCAAQAELAGGRITREVILQVWDS
jgi:ketosteroid isomerase-like protein